MRIEYISAEETMPLRNSQLREGMGFEYCRFDSDLIEGAIHLAQVQDGEALCILSLHPQTNNQIEGKGFQLRGMATHPDYLGQGLGRELIHFAINELRSKGANYIWCNARKNAYLFYEKLGFQYSSEEFEIPTVGPHRQMFILLSV